MTTSDEQSTPGLDAKATADALITWAKGELDSGPDNQLKALLLLEKAEALQRTDQVKAALTDLVNAVNADRRLLPAIWSLIHVLIKHKSWKNLVRLRDAEQKAAQTPAERAGAFFSWACFREDQLKDLEGAIESFKRALEEQPDDHAALVAIERAATLAGDLGLLSETLQQQISRAQDGRHKALLLIDLARLQMSLGDGSEEKALELIQQAASIEDGQWYWLLVFGRHAEKTDRRDLTAEALEGRARIMASLAREEPEAEAAKLGAPWVRDRAEAGAYAVALLRRAAALRATDDPEASLADLRRCLELVPDDAVVATDLFQMLIRRELVDEALELALGRIGAISNVAEAALWHIRVAELEAQTKDVAKAIEHYRAALEKYPSSLLAHTGAEALLASNGQWDELAALYKLTAEAVEPNDRDLCASLMIRAAEVSDRYLAEPDRALSLLTHARESAGLAGVADRMRASILCRLERWGEAVQVLEGLLEETDVPLAAIVLLDEIASIQRANLKDVEGAIRSYERIAERDPDALWVQEILAELYTEIGRWRELAQLYRRMAEATDESDERAAAYLAVAGWVLQCRAEAFDEAGECYRAALERSRESALATVGLEELARQGGDRAQWRSLLKQRAETASAPAQIEGLLLTVAFDLESLGDIDGAIESYRELLDRVPDSRAARWGLVRCYRRGSHWRELTEVLEAEVDQIADGDERGAQLLELAEILFDRLGLVVEAEDTLKRALDASPDLMPAALMLSDCARINGSWTELDAYLRKMLVQAPDAAQLIAEERLGLFVGPDRDDAAARVICDVLLEHIPGHRVALFWLAILAATGKDGEARVTAWTRMAEADGGHGSSRLLAQARTIGRISDATTSFPLTIPEGDIPPHLVIAACDSGAIPKEHLEALLQARRELCVDLATRAFWSLELAEAYEERSLPDRAGEIYDEVLKDFPHDVGALEGLARVSESLEQWERLAELAEQLADLYQEPGVAAEQWARVAGTYAKIDASDQIERACRRALELAPSNKAAFVLLAELLGRRGDLKELSDLFEGRIGQVDDPEELTRLLMVQSDLLRQLGENDASASSLETVLLVDGSNRDALKARSVFDVADGRWNAAVNSLVEWAEQADEDERRLSLWRAAEAILDHGGDPKRAIDVLRLLVAVDDREPDTYRRLVLAARRAGEWDEAAGALAKLAELTPDPEERLCAFRSEGMIRHRLTGDALGASHAWEQVISARPHDIEAISALVELGGDARRERIVDDLSRVVMSQVAQDPTDGEPLRSLLLLRTLGNDPDGALCTLRVIDALGEASDEDLEYLSVLGAQAPAAPGRPLDAKGVSLLVHPDQTGIAEQLLLLLAPILHKVYAADISALRLGRPIKDKGGDLLVAKVRSAAELFGVSGVAIRRSDEPSVTITSVQGTEPTIAVGQQHMGHFSEEETFLLGRSMWHIRAGTSFLANRPETQIRAFHDAATKEGFRDFKPSELRLGVDMLQKELHRSLPRRSRRPLAEIATQMARADEDTLLAWCRGAKASSDRAGLLLSGNVAAALMSIVPGWRGDDRSKRASSLQRVRGSDAARQLLLFAVSNEYLALRREVGLATESW